MKSGLLGNPDEDELPTKVGNKLKDMTPPRTRLRKVARMMTTMHTAALNSRLLAFPNRRFGFGFA